MALIRNLKERTAERISEHWTADTREELDHQLAIEQTNWPDSIYGTCLYEYRLDATGILWHATFTRKLASK